MRKTRLIVHHSDSGDGPAANISAIRRWHMGTPPNGPIGGPYRDIGYHAVCELIDTKYEIIIGRDWDWDGAHTPGQNQAGFGFCLIGSFNEAPPPEAQLIQSAMAVKMIMKALGIPIYSVFPHRFFSLTDCPGDCFPWARFVEMIGG